jgi:hypothetical protein
VAGRSRLCRALASVNEDFLEHGHSCLLSMAVVLCVASKDLVSGLGKHKCWAPALEGPDWWMVFLGCFSSRNCSHCPHSEPHRVLGVQESKKTQGKKQGSLFPKPPGAHGASSSCLSIRAAEKRLHAQRTQPEAIPVLATLSLALGGAAVSDIP